MFLFMQQVFRLDQIPEAALTLTIQGALTIQGPQPQRIPLDPLCHLHCLGHQCVALGANLAAWHFKQLLFMSLKLWHCQRHLITLGHHLWSIVLSGIAV